MLQTAKKDIVRASTTGKSSRSHREIVHMQESKSRAEKEFKKKKKRKKRRKTQVAVVNSVVNYSVFQLLSPQKRGIPGAGEHSKEQEEGLVLSVL